MSNLFNSSFLENLDWSKLFDFRDFSPDEQKHLLQVYTLLLAGALITAGGSYTGIQLTSLVSVGLVELIGILGTLGSLVYIQYRHATDVPHHGKGASPEQVLAFGGFSFSTGLTLVGLLLHTLIVDPRLLFTALLGSVAIFTSLTLSSLLSQRRSYFFLGSILGSLTSYMLLASLASIFIPSRFLFNVLVWGGLLGGIGYTLVDTQVMAESVRRGNRNAVIHGLTLYMDVVRLFVYLLSILLDRRESRDNDRRKRRH
eukprot:Protomagalhaensia_wolfi_Nauph_80__2738@NODE_2864_length_963_cov_277_525974_g2247_i0_p1_GENE_NODE_2864_length_963_cov_277_525974_g2247_i0NODE_2864_length_963_cov_277_525974_g2247_i0_p1_ORF_typecomplete_len257_score21_05Bax1I/PF01027_20/2_4e26SLATT_3/PF18184_1/0_24SLATT_3/PF18184_1/4e02Phage_holin_8/PF16931_5/0_042BT1/PF03092_16/0_074ArAE_2_N/PF10337_9/0_25_NODE_2864_length_963_cov_277_525974_g2247_i062832